MHGKARGVRILGVDYGDRHIGLALSDILQITAQPLGMYTLVPEEKENRRYIQDLVRRHEIGRIVVGMPLRLDGSAGTRAEKTRAFAAWLFKAAGVPIEYWDERLTTTQALRSVQELKVRIKDKKAAVNQIAAVIILQGYLESLRADEPPPAPA